MGWFDDDDDDDDEEEEERARKKPSLAMNALDGGDDDLKKMGDGGDGDDEVDPLDAYMTSLQQQQQQEEPQQNSKPKSARLDVDNEDEATSHWEVTAEMNRQHALLEQQQQQQQEKDDNKNENEASNKAKAALESTFHKASDYSSADHRQIDIRLEKVNHKDSQYTSIVKRLLPPSVSSSSSAQQHDWRRRHSVSCHPPMEPIYDFAELQDILPKPVLEWNTSKNMTSPTLVQSQTLGVALAGKDAIVTASTGSGKTLAYLWPLVAHLVENAAHKSRALVLVPTRELALQVQDVAKSLVRQIIMPKLTALAITGGNLGRYQLSQTLIKSKPHVVVATPGRLLDVLSAQQKSKQDWLLPNISFLVLDEADKMLQLGFAPQVTQVLASLRPDRQSILTSATLTGKLEKHCQSWMNHPVRVSIGRTGRSSSHVQQHVMCLPSTAAKQEFLKESLPTFCEVGRTIVFCATRKGVDELAETLLQHQLLLQFRTLHGDKHPTDRQAALKAFAKGDVRLLIATDVAGRGLDVPDIATVINYDPAKNWDTHVHRIGRAGRLSSSSPGENNKQREGSAYTLLLPTNKEFARTLIQAYEREGRVVPEEVHKLVARATSNYNNKYSGRSRNGLGFSSSSSSSAPSASTSSETSASNTSYYGPSATKKSRWS